MTTKSMTKMTSDELSWHVAKVIAEALPPEFVTACIEDAIKKCLTDFKVESYQLGQILQPVLVERTKELLRTKYIRELDTRAEELALRAMSSR